MDLRRHWLTLGESASENLLAWSTFVANTECLWQDTALVQDADAWQRLWFDLEILNALALEQWENQGKPAEWSCVWNKDYRQEAADLATELVAMLCDTGATTS